MTIFYGPYVEKLNNKKLSPAFYGAGIRMTSTFYAKILENTVNTDIVFLGIIPTSAIIHNVVFFNKTGALAGNTKLSLYTMTSKDTYEPKNELVELYKVTGEIVANKVTTIDLNPLFFRTIKSYGYNIANDHFVMKSDFEDYQKEPKVALVFTGAVIPANTELYVKIDYSDAVPSTADLTSEMYIDGLK